MSVLLSITLVATVVVLVGFAPALGVVKQCEQSKLLRFERVTDELNPD